MKIKRVFKLSIIVALIVSTLIISIESASARVNEPGKTKVPPDNDGWKESNANDIDNRMGLKISLIKFDYTKSKDKAETEINQIILLTNELLQTRYITGGGPVARNAAQVHAGVGITGNIKAPQAGSHEYAEGSWVTYGSKSDYGIKQEGNNPLGTKSYVYDNNLGFFKLSERTEDNYSMQYNYDGCPAPANLPGGNVNINNEVNSFISSLAHTMGPFMNNIGSTLINGIANAKNSSMAASAFTGICPSNSTKKTGYLGGKYVRYTIGYTSGQYRMTYKGGKAEIGNHIILGPGINKNKIKFVEDYGISSSVVTKSSINSGSLKSVIKPTLFPNLQKVEQLFNTKIPSNEIEKYYVAVEGIYRQFLDKDDPEYPAKMTGTYLASQVTETTADPEPGASLTNNGTKVCDNGGGSCELYETWYDNYTCSCEGYSYSNCPSTCTASADFHETCKKPVQLKDFSNAGSMHCGVKVTHNIYGTTYDGYSKLLLTKESYNCATTTQPPYDGISDKANEENEHCKITDNENTYTQNEKGNSCAGGNAYYIGPDPKRALVGESRDNGDNLYGIFGGASEGCYKGIKHYFVMDLDDCPNCTPLCKTVCERVTTDKTSNSYLKCAENFCDNDVDETRALGSYQRKRNCILKTCGYKYGQVPQMEGNPGSSKSQSVSSCANMPLYKEGKDPDYTKSNKIQSLTSQCGYLSDGRLIDKEQSQIVACYNNASLDKSLKITDYDGNDEEGDIGFDERRYVNVACKEVAKVTEVKDIAKTYNPGDPIYYSIKTSKSIECTAWFDYEQWKVDYAVIPSFDVLRRNKLLYTYQAFNNLLDPDYEKRIGSTSDINEDVIYTKDKNVIRSSKIPNFEAKDQGGTFRSFSLTQTNSDYPYGRVDFNQYKSAKSGASSNTKSSPQFITSQAYSSVKINPNKTFENLTEQLVDTYNDRDISQFNISKVYLSDLGLSSAYTSKNASPYSLTKVVKNKIASVRTGSDTASMVAYVFTSDDVQEFVYDKYCSQDGKILKQSECAKSGTKGQNVFYVPHKASDTEGPEDSIKGETKINSELPGYKDKQMYQDTDTCKFEIKPTPDTECECTVIDGQPVGNNYNMKAKLRMDIFKYNSDNTIDPSDLQIEITSNYRPKEIKRSKVFDIEMSGSAKNIGLEDIEAKGTYTDPHSSERKTCTCNITLINKCKECIIKDKGNGNYEIKTSYSGSAIVRGGFAIERFTQDDKGYPQQLQLIRKTKYDNQDGYFIISAKNLPRQSAGSGNVYPDEIDYMWAYVKNGSAPGCISEGNCDRKYCKKTEMNPEGLYYPGQIAQIRRYCSTEYKKDGANYESPAACEEDCADICPKDTVKYPYKSVEMTKEDVEENRKIIEQYCRDNHNEGFTGDKGFSDLDVCIFAIYSDCINQGNFEYRPVNTKNPFPYAVDNERITGNTYESGDRPVGSNWQRLEKVITDGPSYSESKYRITLDLNTVNEIKSYAKELNSGYAAGKNSGSSKNGYKSELLNEKINSQFCYFNGAKRGDC